MLTYKKGEWCEIIVSSEWDGKTIDDIVKEEWKVPKKLLHEYRMQKSIQINGEYRRWTDTLQEGDKLQVHMFIEEEYGVTPEYQDVEIIYEDDHLLIVNKPYGMDTHPSEKGGTHTLANGVAYHLQANGIFAKVRHIHRLDKDTTGGVVFAKHSLAGAVMDRLLMERNIKRRYIALVEGKVNQKKGIINKPIGRDRHHSTRRRVSPTGDSAVTRFYVSEYFSKQNVSLVHLELETGRTHQIRVHMSDIGYPLVGDKLYGGQTTLLNRQALHAEEITMLHPITKEKVEVSVPLPSDLFALLGKLK
ncbi:RluA family pseudouridine synthase [Bacillus sp. 165]|uniref:RluA family pseudouridine synthase n=1 Tax=Bacillus sp. 165 TaxID=1529117 RepID=UPI001ADCD5E9|nr:RluA family pseudouridine synthase [Bacillus sp. 165]MBO9128481.1 RluA family pseudouridine synthase [Bacillus sp. 165]